MKLHDLSTVELIHTYSEIIRLLKESKVIRTKNVVGDLAEFLVIEHYNSTPGLPKLQASQAGTKAFDATSRMGDRYSIKGTSGSSTGVIYGLNSIGLSEPDKQIFEFLVVAKFDDNYRLIQIIEIEWHVFLAHKKWHKTMNAWFVTLTKSLLKESKVLFSSESASIDFFEPIQPHKSH